MAMPPTPLQKLYEERRVWLERLQWLAANGTATPGCIELQRVALLERLIAAVETHCG
jgi:hypothetical protein